MIDLVEPLPLYTQCDPPPLYSPLREEERILKNDVARYTYRSGRVNLDLGPKMYGTQFQAYGKNDPIAGSVNLSGRVKGVTRIEVKVEAVAMAMFSERGLPAAHTEHELVTLTKVLHSGLSDLENGTVLPFSFDLPEEIVVGEDMFALPPSSKWYHINLAAEIIYKITVDVSKRGLARHERIETEILYLPKTRSVKVVPMSWGLSPHDAKREYIDMTNWVKMALKPSWKKGISPPPESPLLAELRLPSCFFSGYPPLSFHVHLQSNPSTAYVFNLSNYQVDVKLVRQVSISVNGRVSTMETIVGQTTVYTERSTPTTRDVYGKIGFGVEGQETSWCVGNIVRVMHAAKVELKPAPGDESRLPSFVHRQRVWMNTDDWADNAPDREGPALGLMSTAMGWIPSNMMGLTPSGLTPASSRSQ